jgi:hypothetical protein
MDNVPPIPNYKIEFPKGKFNGIWAYYNMRTNSDLGLGFAALHCIACGCDACKEQLARPWLPCVEMHEQLDMPQMRSVCCGGVMRGKMIGESVSCSL